MKCTPTGSLAAYPGPRTAVCVGSARTGAFVSVDAAVCPAGTLLTAVAAGDDDWAWAGPDGRTWLDTAPPGLREDPAGWWEQLARTDIAVYSVATCASTLGMLAFTHQHSPHSRGDWDRLPGPRPPVCHGWPMRLLPAGWSCRPTGSRFPFEAA